MVEGHHVSSDDKKKEQRSPREQKGASLLPEVSLDDSNGDAFIRSKGMLSFDFIACCCMALNYHFTFAIVNLDKILPFSSFFFDHFILRHFTSLIIELSFFPSYFITG